MTGADKESLRKQCLARRRSIENKTELDSEIFHRLTRLEEIRSSEVIFVYVSSPIEVDTLRFIDWAIESGKKVAAPLCDTEKCLMSFYAFNSFDCLKKGAYKGIAEPDVKRCASAFADSKTVCLVPGLSFDKNGFRLGFGKGYYDRFLSDFSGITVGLCYDDFLCEKLPTDEFDKNVSVLVTEKEIYKL